jgi:membrane-bound metal-dependent hydrolase YbcI (DUF457 family)
MGNYRQHIGLSGVLGIVYGWMAHAAAGVHWLYGSVAALLTAVSGLLPDLDHPVGVELKGFTGILGVLTALAVWQHVRADEPAFPFELDLLAVIAAYLLIRHGLRHILSRLMVHRGIWHSIPTCAVWGAATYLYYPSPLHSVRVLMTGFFSHLLLDEICSVDLAGSRVNKAFGTAIKLWAPSPLATLAIYALLSYLVWQVIQCWPSDPWSFEPLPHPEIPLDVPVSIPRFPGLF